MLVLLANHLSDDRATTAIYPLSHTTLFRSPRTRPPGRSRRRVLPSHSRQRPRDRPAGPPTSRRQRSEEHTFELQSHVNLVCRLLLEKKKSKPISSSTLSPL